MIDPLDCCNFAQLKARVRLAESEAGWKFVSGLFFGFLIGVALLVIIEMIVVFGGGK